MYRTLVKMPESLFRRPKPMSLESSVAQNWKDFKCQFDILLEAREAANKADVVKIAMLLNCMGEEATERFDQLKWAEPGEDGL